MKRAEAKQALIAMGIEEPTEEQISTLLDTVSVETRPLQEQAGQAATLQEQLEEIQNQNLSDEEKRQKQIEALENQNKMLLENSLKSEAKAILKGSSLDNETIEAILPGMVAGLDKVEDVQARTNAYVGGVNKVLETKLKEHEKKELDNTHVPGAKTPPGEDKTDAEKIAENIGKTVSEAGKGSADIISAYTK